MSESRYISPYIHIEPCLPCSLLMTSPLDLGIDEDKGKAEDAL